MYRIAFVILHYETLADTVECADSIVSNIDYPSWYMVIVDNGSVDHPADLLIEKYKNDTRIHVLTNEKNLGFAKGNNTGYQYAKTVLQADFIVIINNDTLIKQPDFVDKLITRYDQKRYDILGPDILSLKDGTHQNPRQEVLDDPEVVKKYISYFRISLLLNYFLIDNLVIRIKKFFLPGSGLPGADHKAVNPQNKEMAQVKLHGSALVFSPDYIHRYDHAFYPETFLYCEESILNHFVRKDGLITVYYPETIIYHKEDVTSNYVNKQEFRKRRFFLKYNIQSAKVLLKLMTIQKL
jgi:GT2 family glycosyltransferase